MIGGWLAPVGDAVRDGRVQLVCSDTLLKELAGVIARPRFARYIAADKSEQILQLFNHSGLHFDPGPPPRICRDVNDDFLLALADVSKAEYLVTRDDDLLVLARHGATQIIYPARFLQLIQRPAV